MKFAIWRTIKLGTCKTPDEYRTALKKARYRIGDWGNDILGKTSCSQDETKVNLVVISIKELGFNKGAYYESICAKTLQTTRTATPASSRLSTTAASSGSMPMTGIPRSSGELTTASCSCRKS
jgi:hypothetical protein